MDDARRTAGTRATVIAASFGFALIQLDVTVALLSTLLPRDLRAPAPARRRDAPCDATAPDESARVPG